MILRNETTGPDGTVLTVEIVDLDADTITVESPPGNVIEATRPLTDAERAANTPPPPTVEDQLAVVVAALDDLTGGGQ